MTEAHARGQRIQSLLRKVLAGAIVALGLAVALIAIAVDDGPAEAGSPPPTPIFERTGTPLPTIDKADPPSLKIAGGEPRMFFRLFGNGSTCEFQIRLKGVFTNGANFDWIYEVQDLDGGGCGLSHIVFSLCQPNAFNAYVDADEFDAIVLVKPDPTTGLTGVKFNNLSEMEDFRDGNFTYTLSNNFTGAVSDILVAFKVGKGTVYGTIEGPDCTAKKTTPNKPTLTTAVHNAAHGTITKEQVGNAVHDQATLDDPLKDVDFEAGVITFTLYPTNNCTGTPVNAPENVAFLAGSGPITVESSAKTTLSAGSYSYQASYAGDTNHAGQTGACEPFTVNDPVKPTLTTEVHDADHIDITNGEVLVGTVVHDEATLTDTVPFEAGVITFTLYDNLTCDGSVVNAPEDVKFQASAGPITVESSDKAALALGDYSYKASYAGDTNHAGQAAACEPFTVGDPKPDLTTEVHDAGHADITNGEVLVGTTVHDQATLTSTVAFEAGVITFTLYDNLTCNGSEVNGPEDVAFGAGAGPITVESSAKATLAVGSYSYKAFYAGDATHTSQTAACEPFTVNPPGNPRMQKCDQADNDGDTIKDAEGCSRLVNVFLTRQGAKIPPDACLVTKGTTANVAELAEKLSQAITGADPKNPSVTQQLAAFEFEVHYDSTKVCIDINVGAAFEAAGAVCIVEDDQPDSKPQLEGVARIGCITIGKGHGIDELVALASIDVYPQPEIYSQAKPNQDNGVVVQISNVGCDLSDEQGHAIKILSCDDADITFRYLEGDVEPDCVIDAVDAQAIAFRWGVEKGSTIYKDFMNLEPSGTQSDSDIDINDLQFVFGRFGSTCKAPHPPQPPVNPKA
ncbi:MAG: Ig-like domain repeat protein [Chloroflexi bacterium]|nr:Ig-like domain repeat protein [Chloroflexota bacterium]